MKLFKIIAVISLSFLLAACGSTASEEILPEDTTVHLPADSTPEDSDSNSSDNQPEDSDTSEAEPDSENDNNADGSLLSGEDTPEDTAGNQTENPAENESAPETDSDSPKDELGLDDSSILVGDVVLSLNESRQDILAKLDEAGLEYNEREYVNPHKEKFDFCYGIDCLEIFFLDDVCVRFRMYSTASDGWNFRTARGLRQADTYARIVELYGDSYETHSYGGQMNYTTYCYSFGDYLCEFGIPTEPGESLNPELDPIYNIDVYLLNQVPVYEYGPEMETISVL